MTAPLFPVFDAPLSDRDRLDLDRISATMRDLSEMWSRRPATTRNRPWQKRALLLQRSPTCAACGLALVVHEGHGKRPTNAAMLSLLIPEDHGGVRFEANTAIFCEGCARSRNGRDLITWIDSLSAPPKHQRPLRIQRVAAFERSINNCVRHPWKSKGPVLRELAERWRQARCHLYAAQRDCWDNGQLSLSKEPFRGWIAWPTSAPPTGAVLLILRSAGARLLPDSTAPGWTVGTVEGTRWRDCAWSLVEANSYLQRFELDALPRAQPRPEPPPPLVALDTYCAPAFNAGGMLFGAEWLELEAEWKILAAEHADETATYESDLADWKRWPPPGSRGPDDDWWRTFWTVGQVTRRRPTPPRTGRFRERPMWRQWRAPGARRGLPAAG